NYAELLLQAHPENDALRLTLIDLLVKLGDFEQARHHLALLRGLHLYYHFYSGTKQASIRTMHQIYAAMQAEHPLSLWMSDY
ncbi:tetratricopeptide repeat protein, partial [Pseudomonas aeruginosa]|uniref:tetratricopeptide repeat protein n=1 Tax=Pseudomonas aeruginosa TaxID=287 RepID=UPI002340B747